MAGLFAMHLLSSETRKRFVSEAERIDSRKEDDVRVVGVGSLTCWKVLKLTKSLFVYARKMCVFKNKYIGIPIHQPFQWKCDVFCFFSCGSSFDFLFCGVNFVRLLPWRPTVWVWSSSLHPCATTRRRGTRSFLWCHILSVATMSPKQLHVTVFISLLNGWILNFVPFVYFWDVGPGIPTVT